MSECETETFNQRKEAAISVLADLAKWEHCTHDVSTTNDFEYVIQRAVERECVPPFVWNDRYERVSDYAWQVFATCVGKVATDDPDGVLRKKASAERTLKQGRGKPSATDGSKGQWRSYHGTRVRTYEWLLNGSEDE